LRTRNPRHVVSLILFSQLWYKSLLAAPPPGARTTHARLDAGTAD